METITFTNHAVERIKERNIDSTAVRRVIKDGEIIEKYPDDPRGPSCLIGSGFDSCALHVVTDMVDSSTKFVITAYLPDNQKWKSDFRMRR